MTGGKVTPLSEIGELAERIAMVCWTIPVDARRIGVDHQQVGAGAENLMTRAGRQDQGIARFDLDCETFVAANMHRRLATADAQRLMRRAVIVGKGIDAVSPSAGPAMRGEALDTDAARIAASARSGDRAAAMAFKRAVAAESVSTTLGSVGSGFWLERLQR